MRLRLTVQRHGLPPVQLLWTEAHILPAPYAAAGSSITISQFVEQVNDVIPLESDDWGLEDYAVEVRGFECLHFSDVAQVLKEDDEVCIRPLQTSDLRIRRITGRHQISSDGKHLIDGVAFGRPFLRKADRPAIRIPPRKRRRLTYEEDEDVDVEVQANDRQIVVRAGFDDLDQATVGDDSDDDDDEDFAPDDEGEEDLVAELEDLQGDTNADVDEGRGVTAANSTTKHATTSWSRRSLKGLGLLALVDENGHPFPAQYENPLLDEYNQDVTFSQGPAFKVRKRGPADPAENTKKDASLSYQEYPASSTRFSRRSSSGSNKSVRFEDADIETPATVRELDDSDEFDGDFEPAGVNESDKENAEPRAEEAETSDEVRSSSDSSSSTFSDLQPSDSEDTSSSGSSSSDPNSDSEPEQQTSRPSGRRSHSSQASSSGSSSSENDFGSVTQAAKGPKVETSRSENVKGDEWKTLQKRYWAQINVTPRSVEETPESLPSSSVSNAVTPGEGAKRTKTRNQRRRESKKLAFLKSQGILPVDADKTEYRKLMQGDKPEGVAAVNLTNEPQMEVAEAASEFEAKRQALLASIASGDVDVTEARDEGAREPEVSLTDRRRLDAKGAMEVEIPNLAATDHDLSMTDGPISPGKGKDTRSEQAKDNGATDTLVPDMVKNTGTAPSPVSQLPRSKLDLSATKRMLFGSLGLRTPKTKEDESEMRERLMKDAKPLNNPRLNRAVETSDDIEVAVIDESWKDKIDLRAVECCHEGIELSTPPFPFVQRWDPQQQPGYFNGNKKKRQQKKRKRNENSYYEESPDQSSQTKVARHNAFDTPSHGSAQNGHETDSIESRELEQKALHDEGFRDSIKVSEQLRRETEDVSERTLVEAEDRPDLPTLPKDPSACSVLTPEKATVGTIIGFKQFEMSAETNWQPRISDYRTAIIKEVMDDGSLQVELAKRDQPANDTRYDEQTGERLYGKFEMPGYDEETNSSNNGKVTIPFEELIDPILVPVPIKETEQSHTQQGQAEENTATQDDEDNHNSNQQVQAESASTNQDRSNDTVTLEEHHVAGEQSVDFDGTAEVMVVHTAMPSEETRQEISQLIRDAGWRSSVGPGLNGSLGVHEDEGVSAKKEHMARTDTPWSQSHGFSSSPSYNTIDVASSPLPLDIKVAKRQQLPDVEIADSVPPPDVVISDTHSITSDTKLTVEYPDLPQMGDDSELFQGGAQHRSHPHGIDHEIPSQDLSSLNGMDQSPAQSTRSRSRLSQEKDLANVSKALDPVDSDNEFPALFSQAFEARVSQDKDIKPESSFQGNSISPPAKRRSDPTGTHCSLQKESNRDWRPDGESSGSDDGEADSARSTPRPSQPPQGSQVVDLTISSDPPHTIYSDDDDDSFALPKGSGWVKKSRSSVPRNVPAKANSGRRKTNSR